ncbi:hypothetical protein Aperf_G00000083098 [Anoplocephala perfoliata]
MAESCGDSLPKHFVPNVTTPSFPEQAYGTSNGVESGVSIMGFRSGRFTPAEAQSSLKNRLYLATKDVEISQKTRENNADLMTATLERTKSNFVNTTESLRSRLHDIHQWATELETEIQSSINATELLIKRKGELETSLRTLDECLLLTTDCINARQRRFGEDLQQDEVEMQLLRELDIINKHTAFTKEAIANVNEQINKNRESKSNMEKAWSDKHEADLLDSEAAHLSPCSNNVQHYAGEARSWPQAAQSTPMSWMQHAQDLIVVSEEQRRASCLLSGLIEKLLTTTENAVIVQKDNVNFAFQRRLDEYELEKQKLTEKLHKVCEEIAKQESSIEELKNSKAAKEPYLKVVQTRLHLHNQRQNVENCRDPPQHSILNELHDLEETLDQLESQILKSSEKLKHLQDEQLILERQIHMKNSSIQVDKEHCARHRQRFPAALRLRGH